MCGPLSLFAASDSKSSWLYQVGRLNGYLAVGLLLSFLGVKIGSAEFSKLSSLFWWGLVLAISLSLFFSFVSLKNISSPLERLSQVLAKRALKQRGPRLRAYIIGVSSVFLPCGVLYLAMISLLSLSSPYMTALGVLFFWMGTLPLLHWGLPWAQSFIKRKSLKVPRLNAVLIVTLCALILFKRYPELVEGAIKLCH